MRNSFINIYFCLWIVKSITLQAFCSEMGNKRHGTKWMRLYVPGYWRLLHNSCTQSISSHYYLLSVNWFILTSLSFKFLASARWCLASQSGCLTPCVRCLMAPRKQYVIIISSDTSDGEAVSSSVKSLPGAGPCLAPLRGPRVGTRAGDYQALSLIRASQLRYQPAHHGSCGSWPRPGDTGVHSSVLPSYFSESPSCFLTY